VDGAGQSASTRPNQNPNFPNDGNTYQPYQNNPNIPQPCPPGIPCNIPRYIPPTPQTQKDVDDNDDDDGNN
jgi:hypothetical protein